MQRKYSWRKSVVLDTSLWVWELLNALWPRAGLPALPVWSPFSTLTPWAQQVSQSPPSNLSSGGKAAAHKARPHCLVQPQEAMGIVSLTQFCTTLCAAVERSEAPPLEAALLSASRQWKSADFLLESEPFPHLLCLDVGAPNESSNTQLPGSSLPRLWAAYLQSDILELSSPMAAPDFGFICSWGSLLPAGQPCSLSPTRWPTLEPGDLSKAPGFV